MDRQTLQECGVRYHHAHKATEEVGSGGPQRRATRICLTRRRTMNEHKGGTVPVQ